MNEIVLKVANKNFGGWTSVRVEKSLYRITGAFGLAATDIFPGNMEGWGFALGDVCTVEIDGQTIITGHVEDLPISYDSGSHNIQVGGRDKTGDLVDCSFVESANEWKNQRMKHIIEALCKPFAIDIYVDNSVIVQACTKVPEFKANEGDVVFDLIARLCRMFAILPVSYGDGKLTLTRAGTAFKTYDALELGKNVKSGSVEQSNKDRYQTYIVKGHGVGTDEKSLASDVTGVVGRASDDVILRYRPLIVFTETPCDIGRCLTRARWEARNRAGASRSLEYEVQGWVQSNGDVWPLNAMVEVRDSFLGIDCSLLIAAVSYSVDDLSGTITRLSLVHPETFDLLAEPVKKIQTKADWRTRLTAP